MGRGGLGGSSDRMRGVEVNARAANRALEATQLRTASIIFRQQEQGEKNQQWQHSTSLDRGPLD